MRCLSRAGAVGAIAFAATVLCSGEASAQSWQWQSSVRNAAQGTVATESRVVLSPRDVAITYSANVDNHSVPITSCRAELSDIGNVHSVDNGGKLFLFIVLKPQHSASCNSGSQSIAVLPIGRDASANSAVATIMRACCGAAAKPEAAAAKPAEAAAKPAAVAQAPHPTPTPTAAATTAPQSIRPIDWVEDAGLFAFVRLLNRDSRPVVISAGQVLNCRDVAVGCGPFTDQSVTVAPGHVVTLATVTSNNPANAPSFSYRYEVQAEHENFTETGLSSKRAGDSAKVMTAQEIRAAEALAIGQMQTQRSTATATASATPAPPANAPPKLVQRGSSRLGVGQKGVAMVRVGVGRDGSPQYATIISINNRALTAAALETAVSTKFSPAMKNGVPVDGNYVATFQFDGEDPGLASIPVWRRSVSSSPAPSASPNLSAVAVPTPLPSPKPTPSPSPRPSPTQSPSSVPVPSPRGSTP